MANKKVQVQLLDEQTGQVIEDVDVLTTADCVTFTDGQTFQQKLDNGSLRGQTGAKGEKGEQGLQGATGAKGADGAKGDKGDTWRPTVDASGNLSWALNNSGTAPSTINIKGAKGDTGARGSDGAKGADGSKMHNVTGTPATSLGAIGDWALNTTNGDVYEKTASTTWTKRGNFKGAKGDTGAKGEQGERGAQGAQGIQGAKGDPGVKGDKGEKGDPGDSVKVGTSLSSATPRKLFFKVVG